jgi:crossover junction endodeoxyribonuclease RuvC
MTHVFLGVDPGVRGGLAIVEIDDGAAPQLLEAIDIPVTGVGAKERVDVLAIRTWVIAHRPQHAFIERAQAMPKQGASSGFKYGRATGSIEAVLACCEIPITIVEPAQWKRRWQQRSRTPEGVNVVSCRPFPACTPQGSWAGRGVFNCALRRPIRAPHQTCC